MKQILTTVWKTDKKNFLLIIFLNIISAMTSSVSIVMLIPMLDVMDISVGTGSTLGILLQPFQGMTATQRAIVIISAFVGLMLFKAALTAITSIRQNIFMERYEMRLRAQVYDAISTADWEILSAKRRSDLTQLIINQCGQTRSCLHKIVSLISSIFSVLLQLALALWMSIPVTLVVLAVGISLLFLFRPLVKKSKAYGKKSIAVTREVYREIQNQLNSIKEIRAYGVREHNAKRFEEYSKKSYNIHLKMAQLHVTPKTCYSIASAALIALAFVVSQLMGMGTAQLVVLIYIFSRLWPVFSSWQGQWQSIQSSMPAFETIRESLEELQCGTQEPELQGEAMKFTESITFKDLCFAYKNGSEEVLHNINFELPCGSVTALVGPSGAGKSTTADLLLGLLRPTKGQILVDGTVLDHENLGAWRKAIGYIPQEPLIINTTIRDNLQRFHPEATEEEMIDALKRSLAWPFIEKLPEGLDTVLGDKGTRLSGGERQRIVLARVLLGKPRFIILDEATSALDYESESFIRETIRSLRNKTTVLVIAHRMTTIRGADRAIVIQNGAITEQGSLQELLDKADSYLAKMDNVE